METQKETPEVNKTLYSPIEPYCSGMLKVSDLHSIYWEQSGNPSGHRGAGKSTPHACLVDNTTWDLIDDIEKVREALEIPEWQVFGGSWGSTLALAYSQSHPEKGTGLVLRGIFLLRNKGIDWFYEGGAAAIFPDAWEPFRDLNPENERGSFVDAYNKRLNSDDEESTARAWTKWEMMTAHLLPNDKNIKREGDDFFSLTGRKAPQVEHATTHVIPWSSSEAATRGRLRIHDMSKKMSSFLQICFLKDTSFLQGNRGQAPLHASDHILKFN
ncbi:Alpha/beta hydrolase fold-1 [Dillenia turbinata]|uniref:Alpha/beta hydrolase fold-1 n=1 Tax=Dillenia turbinata TaxID=194707 RepID=A0AAN8YX36_9MAGN